METNPKKSIDSLKDHEVDGTNVKGGFTLVKKDGSTAYFNYTTADDMQAAIDAARSRGFKTAVLTNEKGVTTTKNL